MEIPFQAVAKLTMQIGTRARTKATHRMKGDKGKPRDINTKALKAAESKLTEEQRRLTWIIGNRTIWDKAAVVAKT